jgi:hypothetical protein
LKQPVAVEAAQADVEAAYHLTVRITRLFGGFGEEGTGDPRFLLLRIPGISVGELLESPFALALSLGWMARLFKRSGLPRACLLALLVISFLAIPILL